MFKNNVRDPCCRIKPLSVLYWLSCKWRCTRNKNFSSVTIHAKAHKKCRQSFALHGYTYIQLPLKQLNLQLKLHWAPVEVGNFRAQVPLVQRPHIFMVNLEKKTRKPFITLFSVVVRCQLNSDLPSQCEGIKWELTSPSPVSACTESQMLPSQQSLCPLAMFSFNKGQGNSMICTLCNYWQR